MQDLNDLQLFALVVRHGGFAAAERASGEAKSNSANAWLVWRRVTVRG
ncbi:hypothetical protein NFX37_10715 [Serratia marcescens]|nr:hypothetical protein NFX37_10715 [Serratia marcescens]